MTAVSSIQTTPPTLLELNYCSEMDVYEVTNTFSLESVEPVVNSFSLYHDSLSYFMKKMSAKQEYYNNSITIDVSPNNFYDDNRLKNKNLSNEKVKRIEKLNSRLKFNDGKAAHWVLYQDGKELEAKYIQETDSWYMLTDKGYVHMASPRKSIPNKQTHNSQFKLQKLEEKKELYPSIIEIDDKGKVWVAKYNKRKLNRFQLYPFPHNKLF